MDFTDYITFIGLPLIQLGFMIKLDMYLDRSKFSVKKYAFCLLGAIALVAYISDAINAEINYKRDQQAMQKIAPYLKKEA